MSWEPGDDHHPDDLRADEPAPAPPRRGRGRSGRRLLLAFALIAAVIVVALGGAYVYARGQLDAPRGDHGSTVVITVTAGEPFDAIVDDLAAHSLIRSTSIFSLYARLKGLTSVTPGRYRLDGGMAAGTIIRRLEEPPDVETRTVTLPEGLTAAQMARVVAASGVGISADQYLAEVLHGGFSEPFLQHRARGASLEGFLFPDTYTVPVGASAHDLVQMQLDAFASKAAPLLTQTTPTLNDYQVVVLASIVEREARFDADRGLVAGVIVNRLGAGMPLSVDATVSYGVGRTSGEPTKDELARDTPYNTYLHAGLPPTPIGNPGVASIRAAAMPTQSSYLFYVSDACGHNHYATTAAQHEQNITRYVGTPC